MDGERESSGRQKSEMRRDWTGEAEHHGEGPEMKEKLRKQRPAEA